MDITPYAPNEVSVSQHRDRWVRSSDNIIAGVCGGVAKTLDIEPWVVRILWLIAVLVFGTGIAAYLILAYCLPREDRLAEAYKKRFLGVCYRMSLQSGYEVGLIRTLTLVLALASLGVTLIAYVVLHYVLKKDATNAGKVAQI